MCINKYPTKARREGYCTTWAYEANVGWVGGRGTGSSCVQFAGCRTQDAGHGAEECRWYSVCVARWLILERGGAASEAGCSSLRGTRSITSYRGPQGPTLIGLRLPSTDLCFHPPIFTVCIFNNPHISKPRVFLTNLWWTRTTPIPAMPNPGTNYRVQNLPRRFSGFWQLKGFT